VHYRTGHQHDEHHSAGDGGVQLLAGVELTDGDINGRLAMNGEPQPLAVARDPAVHTSDVGAKALSPCAGQADYERQRQG
jgi:hypothetical protein